MKHGNLGLLLSASAVAVALAGCASTKGPAGPINENGTEPYLVPEKITASSNDGNGPERLIDGDIGTRWSASGPGETATLDYGKVATFDAVRLAFSKGDQRETYFDIEVSEDGKTWKKVLSGGESSGLTNTIERFPFAPVQARYVRYVGQGNSKNTWNSVTEFNAVNCKVNTCSALEFINSDTLKAIAAAAPKVKMERNDNPPTSLANWKLTVPVTNEGLYGEKAKAADAYYTAQGTKATSAGEILPRGCSIDGSSLSAETNNPYFKVDKAGWHFRTPLEGGTSTPNSTYIRTELRELNNWSACDATPEANWAYGGTHTLAATLQLNEWPEKPRHKKKIDEKTGELKVVAPKVVLGQIHGHKINAATVKLLWEGKKKPVRVILNSTPEKKSAFSVKLGKIPDPTKPWVYIIKMKDDGIELSAGGVTKTVKFGPEGTDAATLKKAKQLDVAWKDKTFYFKAGLYPQVNKAGGGAFDATFKKIHVSHIPTAPKIEFLPLTCDKAVGPCGNAPLVAPQIPAVPQPGNKPYQNIDLTTWYLSIATDADGNGKADNIQEWHLSQGYEHPELMYTGEDGGLVVRSYIKGVRTSKNTKYTRTEFREMLRKGDKQYGTKGVNKNNWVFGSAPLEDRKEAGGVDGTLDVTMKVDKTTTTGVVHQVGRFIIGQIHDQDDEPIRLYYRKLPNRDTGTVFFAHENTLKGTDDYYDLVGGLDGITDDGIALGEVFSYQIKVVSNTMTVTLSREGKPDVVKVVDMSKSGYDVGGKYMYFKWGAYNQNNTGNPDDFVQATFYKVKATHDAPAK